MACLDVPPLEPGNKGVLVFDGERLAWATGLSSQVLIIGPQGPAFVDFSVVCGTRQRKKLGEHLSGDDGG